MNETKFLAKLIVIWTNELMEQKGSSYVVKMGYTYLTRWHEYLKSTKIMASKEAEKEFERVFGTSHDIRKTDWNATLNPIVFVPGAQRNKRNLNKFNKISVHKVIHWEHFDTAYEFEKYLIDLHKQGKLTESIVEAKLKELRICWVTKSENDLLTEKKYTSRRPNPELAYQDCGIQYK